MKTANYRYGMGLVLASICTVNPVLAHHSFPAQYDANRPETVTGMVTKMEWRNPHVYFYMDVYDDDGNLEEWSFELSNISAMRNQGWSSDTLKPGDQLEVHGSRARDNSPLLNATDVTRTDSGEKIL